MAYIEKMNYENLQRHIFKGIGKYDIPQIKPELIEKETNFIGFNYLSSCKDKNGKSVHFFLDDYQFNRVWNNIELYIPNLMKCDYVLSPDFSLYTDFPKALQIYNHYRKHWCGAYMQLYDVKVIPTIAWSDEDSYEWCFDGEPIGGAVAVSSVGCMNNKESEKLFIMGYNEMLKRLQPKQILFYGKIPSECKNNGEEIIELDAFYKKFENKDKRIK